METEVSYTKTSLYGAIFKRKSFHLFRGVGDDRIERSELDAIADAWQGFERLLPEIRTAVRIVPASEVNFKRDAEYCIMIYSEKKENYLMNAGYLGEQREITEEEMAMFRKATENDSLAVYTPLSVSTQVVAGTNYKFWCRFEETSDKYGHCWITIFKPLPGQGEPEVTSIEPQVSE